MTVLPRASLPVPAFGFDQAGQCSYRNRIGAGSARSDRSKRRRTSARDTSTMPLARHAAEQAKHDRWRSLQPVVRIVPSILVQRAFWHRLHSCCGHFAKSPWQGTRLPLGRSPTNAAFRFRRTRFRIRTSRDQGRLPQTHATGARWLRPRPAKQSLRSLPHRRHIVPEQP